MIPVDPRPKAERGTLDLLEELHARRRQPLALGNRIQIALIVTELDVRAKGAVA